MAFPSLCRDPIAVDDALFVAPFSSTLSHFEADVFVAGDRAIATESGGQEDLDAVTDCEEPLALIVKFAGELDEGSVMPKELRGPATDEQHAVVVLGFDVGDGFVGLDQVAWFFDIGVPVGMKVVNDAVEALLLAGGDNRCHSSLKKAVFCVKNLKGFACIVGDDKYFTFLGHTRNMASGLSRVEGNVVL